MRYFCWQRSAEFAVTPQPCLRRHTFSGLSEKVCKKRRWIRIGLYRGATEAPRRRTLRPTHETLSTKLNYSATCVETALSSIAVAAQGDGKTRCRGMQNASTCSTFVGSENYRENSNSAPDRASNKFARVSALYKNQIANQRSRLQFGEDEQRNGRGLPPAAGRGIWSLRGRSASFCLLFLAQQKK